MTNLPYLINYKDIIYIVIDQKSKITKFILTTKIFNIAKIAKLFCKNIYKDFGIPVSITFDQDSKFTFNF